MKKMGANYFLLNLKKICKISILVLIFVFIANISFYTHSKTVQSVSAGEDYVFSYYLYDEDTTTIEKQDSALGKTYGYGCFALGAENVCLKAEAHAGYKIVGWYIDDGTNTELITATKKLDLDNNGSDDVGLTIAYQDKLIEDGENDCSTLTISKIYQNLKIEPVFNYIEYTLDLDEDSKSYLSIKAVDTYHIGETIDVELKVIDGCHIGIKTISVENTLLRQNQLELTKDSSGLTQTVKFKVAIQATKSKKNIITCTLSVLYKVTIEIETEDDNSDYEGEILTKTMNWCLFNYSVKKQDSSSEIYVGADSGFKVSAYTNHSVKFDGISYNYYTLDSVKKFNGDSKADGESIENGKAIQGITTDFRLVISYSLTTYSVNFLPAIKSGNKYNLDTSNLVNVLSSVQVKRGSDLKVSDLSTAFESLDHTGFTFMGYTSNLAVSPVSDNEKLICKIDANEPTTINIYMCFDYKLYSIEIVNLNENLVLKDNDGKDVYAIARYELRIGNKTSVIDTPSATTSISNAIKLGETLKCEAILNEGFQIDAITFNGFDKESSNNFVLTKDYITEGLVEENIQISIAVSLKTFQLIYKIDKKYNGEKDDIYAEISASHNITRGDEGNKVVVTETNHKGEEITAGMTDLDAIPTQIVISNLYMYDKVKLQAVPKTAGDYTYSFNEFRLDSKIRMTYEKKESAYSTVQTIYQDSTVEAIFSTPVTSLKILYLLNTDEISTAQSTLADLSGDEDASISVNVQQAKTSLSADDDGYYVIDVSKGEITLEFSNLSFGYVIDNYYLYIEDELKSSAQASPESYSYTPTDGNQILYVGIKTKNYRLRLFQSSNALKMDKEEYKFGEDDYLTVTVLNSNLEFNKPEGYYVSKFYVGSQNPNLIEGLSEENDGTAVEIYSQNIKDSLSLMVDYGVVENDILYINCYVEYSIYTFNIEIQCTGLYPGIEYPSFIASGVTGIEQNVNGIGGVPYGTDVKVTVDRDFVYGTAHGGWGKDEINPDYSVTLREIKENKVIIYNAVMNSYKVVFSYDGDRGTPEITNGQSNYFLNDGFTISAKPSAMQGYKFKEYYYQKYTYYDKDSFKDDYDKLYYFEYGEPVKNTSEDKDSSKKYYYIEDVYFNKESLVVEKFNPLDFLPNENNIITININYTTIELKVENKSNEISYGTNGTISGNNIASYTVKKTVADNEYKTLSTGDTVNVKNRVRVEIVLNKKFEYDTNKFVDLNSVLSIWSVKVAEIPYIIVQTASINNEILYVLEFDVIDIIWNAIDIDIIEIEYSYTSKVFTFQVATNIDSNSYGNFTKSTWFKVTNEETGGQYIKTNDVSILSETGAILSNWTLEYQFGETSYDLNFVVESVKLYDLNVYSGTNDYVKGALLGEFYAGSDDAKNEIRVSNIANNHHIIVDYTLIKNIYIELQVLPKLTFNGIDESSGCFVKEFQCNGNGYGIEQTLTLGTSGKNITYPDIFKNMISVTYDKYDSKGNIIENTITPKDCALYRVNIKFSTNDTNLKWVTSVKYKEIRLKITPMEITVEGKENYNKQEIDYGNPLPNFNTIKQVLQFKNKGGTFTLNCSFDTNVALKLKDMNPESGAYFLSVLQNKEHVPVAGNANENSYYDLTIKGLSITETTGNNNFKLVFDKSNIENELTIASFVKVKRKKLLISGVSAYNKVYDGTRIAHLEIEDETHLKGAEIDGLLIKDKENFYIDVEKLSAMFVTSEIGAGNRVVVDFSQALSGLASSNYYIDDITIYDLAIFPDMLETYVKDYGTITIENKIGKEDYSKAGLIPIGAKLTATAFEIGSTKYAEMYMYFENKITRSNIFAVGYEISFTYNGVSLPINNGLDLYLPNVGKVSQVMHVNKEYYGDLTFAVKQDRIHLNLNNLATELNTIIIFKHNPPLALWQIVLIVISGILVVGGVSVALVLARRRKRKLFISLNDKI